MNMLRRLSASAHPSEICYSLWRLCVTLSDVRCVMDAAPSPRCERRAIPYHPHLERTEDHVSNSSGDASRQGRHDAHQRALALVRLRFLASFLHPSARTGGALRPARCSALPSAARQRRVDAFLRTAYNQENRDPWPPMARRSRRRNGAARR